MMKYLLPYLETLPDGPNLSDPEFQQLLVDIQAGKTQTKSADAFYESLEKIVNELKSTPEALAFIKPVAKRDAPDYYDVIKKPMDLTTILKNIKSHRYKNKADFAADLDLIWENCFHYNTSETHPVRMSARYMKQKAEHHLEFLQDRVERGAQPILPFSASTSTRQAGPSVQSRAAARTSPSRAPSQVPGLGGEEDAAGESDDGGAMDGIEETFFRDEAGAGPQAQTAATEQGTQASTQNGGSGGAGDEATVPPPSGAGGLKPNGIGRSAPPFRPKLQTSLETAPAFVRTPYSMSQYANISLNHAGPSTLEKSKELLSSTPPPVWFPGSITAENEDVKLEGGWWGVMARDDAYVAGLPAVPAMAPAKPLPRLRVPSKRRRSSLPNGNHMEDGAEARTPPLESPKRVKLESVIYRSVDKLHEARKVMGQISDWQKLEAEGGALPNLRWAELEEKERIKEEQATLRTSKKEFEEESRKRRKTGGEVGEVEAARVFKRASASLLAHAGFEGAEETALDLFTRVAIDHIRNIGRTFRLYLDGQSHRMSPEELVLHSLHENGQVQTQHLEAHIKDDIEREGGKIAEMTRKVKQAYKEVTTAPVIQDDMLFADNREMLTDGNFAEELGEDFLGLRELGIDKEFGLRSLNVPSSLFHGRRKRVNHAEQNGDQGDVLDYRPPPPFIPLQVTTYTSHLPALLHPFFASLIESGKGLADDEGFDQAHSQIGSLGQIVIKSAAATNAAAKKAKKEAEAEKKEEKKPKPKKIPPPGVGKGNWVRPPKEERDKQKAEKKAAEAEFARMRAVSASDDAEGEAE